MGTSSTGKTRACWQAVQPLAEKGWRLWHPFDPTRVEAALEDLHRVGPRTVVWLNEVQHYLGDREFGERIAAAEHHLLIDERRGPVLGGRVCVLQQSLPSPFPDVLLWGGSTTGPRTASCSPTRPAGAE
ncbi:hypothetical protein [Streptomyces zhihengii]|uniref:hypothetical protein n=1 Tax=Streptomyces zhihengii TaxID=1818004 RepID=UPI0033A02CFA